MVVVTGSCRTGTSLVMQTLKLIGMPVLGLKFHKEFEHKELNPKGYYNLPIKEVIGVINNGNQYKGRAVKLHGYELSKTEPKHVQRIVVCKRLEADAIESTLRILKANQLWTTIPPTRKIAKLVYNTNYDLISQYIIKNKILNIIVRYEDMLAEPQREINRIREFIGYVCDITKAVKNVDRR